MRLIVLGCSGGYPEPNRACSGYLVEAIGKRLWLDAGSGTLARLLGRCSLADVDAVWLTHLHPDHWTDLPLAIHAIAVGAGRPREPLPVYGPRNWAGAVGVDLHWRGDDYTPLYAEHQLRDGLMIRIGDVSVRSAAVEHGIETYALRVEAEGASFAYSADSAPCEALVELAGGVDMFLCAAGTMTTSAIHPNPRQAGEMAAAARVKRLLLTHLRPGADRERARAMAREAFAGPIEIASEGAVYDVSVLPASHTDPVGYSVLRPDEQTFERPSWRPDEPLRRLVELPLHANLRHSQANLWRYPPGARGRRHREPVQEEVFCVVEGTLTMLLGEPPQRFELPAHSLVAVEPQTPLQLRNESDSDVLVFAYGAPYQSSDYSAEILKEPD
jgi:ribonuclease BN (tRNA processing enzyme)/quercetin dioxygenase-like cupin family protein